MNKANMWFYILCCLYSFLFFFSCNSGTSKHNSLNSVEDSLRTHIDTLNEQSYYYRNQDPEKSKALAFEAIVESEKIQYLIGLAEAYNRLGLYEKNNSNLQNALAYYRISLRYRKQIDSVSMLGSIYNSIGTLYRDSTVFDSSIYYLNKALIISEAEKDLTSQALYSNNIANTYDNFGDYQKALDYHKQSFSIREKLGDKKAIAQSCLNIGSVYHALEEYDSALIYLRQGILYKDNLEERTIAKIYNNTGMIFQSKKNPDTALYYFKLAITHYEAANDIDGLSIALANMGILYQEQYKNDKGLPYLLESTQMAAGDDDLLEQNYMYLGSYYNSKGFYDTAAHYYNLSIQIDTARQDETDRQIRSYAAIQTQFIEAKAEEEKKEILLKQKQKELVFKIIISSAIAGIIILSLLFNRRQLKKKIEYQKKLAQDRTRISSDLHDDIGAALSSISMYSDVVKMQVENKDFDEANTLLTEIASTSRELMDHMSDLVWAINPKNDNFEKIIQRSKSFAHRILQAKNIQLRFSAPDQLDDINMPMEVRHNLYMIYKEAINNAAKYSQATLVKMEIIRKEKKVISRISDNGKGFELSGDKEGNGLKNMKRRAGEIHADFSMQSAPGEGTDIEVIYNIAV